MIEEKLTPAMRQKLNQMIHKDYRATFYERLDCLKDSEPLFEDLPYPQRYGNTLQYSLDRISVCIHSDEKIVGSVKEIIPSQAQVDTVEKLTHDWWDRSLPEIQQKILWFYSYNWLRRRPPWFYSFGHLGLDWEKLLARGLGGYLADARRLLEKAEGDDTKKNFLAGAILCYQALSLLIQRYAQEAEALAGAAGDEPEKNRLIEIASICRSISTQPAQSFREALQLIWLIVLPLMKVCGCGVFDLGRMDQYLLPYFAADLERGRLTRDEALELIVEFFYKNNEIMSPADHMSLDDVKTQFTLEMTFDDPNYIILGGLLPGNRGGVNEVTHLFIEAQHILQLRNPFIVLRYYSGIAEDFWQKACAAMRDNAAIVIYNDNTMIPALTAYGIREEDAINYGFYGCNDPDITGKQGGLRQLWFNLVLPLELALNPQKQRADFSADSPPTPSQFALDERMIGLMKGNYHGIRTKPLAEIQNIDDLLGEYRKQLRFLIADFRTAFEQDVDLELKFNKGRIRIEDCFLDGTMEKTLTWNDGGTPYNVLTVQGSGVATVADSLAAIHQIVFSDQEMSLTGLAEVLNQNFADAQPLQDRLKYQLPKFGNDVEWVDQLARKVVDIFCDEVAAQNSDDFIYTFLPTLSTDRAFTDMGEIVGASADGRKAKDPISENQSPTLGAEREGITALLNSVSKIPFNRITGGPLNLKIHPSAVQGKDGLQALAALLKTYMELGGMQVQLNILSRQQLQDAQKQPQKYEGLCIRVTGYSAYFTQMGKKAQDEIIMRTELA
jgi:trans-4-hydroxy-L-proline dehydratase